MYIKEESGTERSYAVENVIEDIPGGGTVAHADFKDDSDDVPEGVLLGIDLNGLYHLVKSAKIVTGGSSSAPRINKAHELKVGDIVSDGNVSLEIATITEGATYDTLTFDSGVLTIYAANTILYQVERVDTTGTGVVATASVEDTLNAEITITIPIASQPANFNGIDVVLSQNTSDALDVSYAAGTLSIKLANSTAIKNNVSVIEAAIQVLGIVELGIDFTNATVADTGSGTWDGGQTGATLTSPSDDFGGGVNYGMQAPKYVPAGVSMNTIDLTNDNLGCGICVRGTVRESLCPYFLSDALKAYIPLVRFV